MKTSNYTPITVTFLNDTRATVSDRSVYVALLYLKDAKTNKVSQSITTICKYALLSEKTVRKSLKHLEELGHISVQQQQGNKSNIYTILKEDF